MKILAILPRVPFPLEKGDKLRAYHLLKEMSAYHEISIFALTDKYVEQGTVDELKKFCKKVGIFRQSKPVIAVNLLKAGISGLPFQSGYYFSKLAQEELFRFIKSIQPDHLFFQMVRMAPFTKYLEQYPKTIDYMDALSENMRRRSEKSSLFTKWLWRSEFRRLQKYESRVFDLFDHHFIISGQDRDLIKHPKNKEIHVIPNGINLKRFAYKELPKEFDLIFTGNMAYPPNVLACEYIVNRILPLLKARYPDIRVALVGINPKPAVKQLASKSVTVTGWVDDMSDYYARSKILLAPMEIGAGLQNKILEAMAMKLPVITSRIAGNAMHKNAQGCFVSADSPEEYANQVLSLLESEQKRHELGNKGYEYVLQYHNWAAIARQCVEIIEGEK
jgi:sugar transferase (PEP-CTERM/EpsH1 system associated)